MLDLDLNDEKIDMHIRFAEVKNYTPHAISIVNNDTIRYLSNILIF